jgi:hypothetical protein
MYDYEIQEIMRIRQQIAAETQNDLKTLAKYYRQIEKELRNSGKYKFINRIYNNSYPKSQTQL